MFSLLTFYPIKIFHLKVINLLCFINEIENFNFLTKRCRKLQVNVSKFSEFL